MELNYWLIFGEPSTRKGSLIRALSGIARDRDFDVSLVTGERMRMWARIRSINEDTTVESPHDWVKSCQQYPKRSRSNILAAFRFDIGQPGYGARDYLDEIVRVNAHVVSVVVLGQSVPSWLPEYGMPYLAIPDTDVPTAEIAEVVRDAWGWR